MSDDTTGNRARRHAVAKALLREMERGGGGWNARNMADAAIAAAIPPGSVVVSRADLRAALALVDRFRATVQADVDLCGDHQAWWTVQEIDQSEEIDRLKAALEEQG